MIKKSFKNKIILPIITSVLVATGLAPVTAMAATSPTLITPPGNGTGNNPIIVVQNQTKLNKIIADGNTDIANRLVKLNDLTTVVNNTNNKLSSGDRTYLLTEIQSEISGLTTLKTHLDAETSLSAAQTDFQNIFLGFRVFALVAPKVTMVKAADDQQTTEGQLVSLETKLQDRINNKKSGGSNVAQLQGWLNAMESFTTSSSSISSSVESNVLPLAPAQYNANHSLLVAYYSQLAQARADNKSANSLAQQIVSGLKSL